MSNVNETEPVGEKHTKELYQAMQECKIYGKVVESETARIKGFLDRRTSPPDAMHGYFGVCEDVDITEDNAEAVCRMFPVLKKNYLHKCGRVFEHIYVPVISKVIRVQRDASRKLRSKGDPEYGVKYIERFSKPMSVDSSIEAMLELGDLETKELEVRKNVIYTEITSLPVPKDSRDKKGATNDKT